MLNGVAVIKNVIIAYPNAEATSACKNLGWEINSKILLPELFILDSNFDVFS